jgi:syntaxin-binding protein 1
MTHILVRDGMKSGDRDHFARKAALTPEERQIIENLKYLNVNLDKVTGARKRFKRPKRRKPMPENVYELSRYVPWVKEVLEDFAEGVLTADYAPFVREPAGATGGKRKGIKSLKTVTRRRQTKFGDIKEEKEKMIFKGRVIVFIAGGCTYSETRTAYEIIKQYRWDVILGGSSILTPQYSLERLSELKGEES